LRSGSFAFSILDPFAMNVREELVSLETNNARGFDSIVNSASRRERKVKAKRRRGLCSHRRNFHSSLLQLSASLRSSAPIREPKAWLTAYEEDLLPQCQPNVQLPLLSDAYIGMCLESNTIKSLTLLLPGLIRCYKLHWTFLKILQAFILYSLPGICVRTRFHWSSRGKPTL
jgi:hypothetical protein